jgi:hypothetical protein
MSMAHVLAMLLVRVLASAFACMCINAGMPDCQASDQSSTGMKKTNDAGTSLVLDQADEVRHFFGPILD